MILIRLQAISIQSLLLFRKRLKPDLRFLSGYLLSITTSRVLKLQRSMRAQMKDILELFKTIKDFKSLSFSVTEHSLIKKQCPVFSRGRATL